MKNTKFNSLITLSLTILLAIIVLKNNYAFYTNYEEAKTKSLSENKPLLIYFYSEKEKIFNLKEIEKDYIICFLNYEKNKKISEVFKIEKLPSYVVVDNNTKEICKIEGEESKQKILRWLINHKKYINKEQN